MLKQTALVLLALPAVIACEGSDAPPASEPMVAMNEIAMAVASRGTCELDDSDSWSYLVHFGPGHAGHAEVTRLRAMPPGLFSVTMMNAAQDQLQGFINTAARTAYWFDPREHRGDGKMRSDSNTIDYPPQTLEDGAREWGKPRSRLLVRLIENAQSTCRTGPFARQVEADPSVLHRIDSLAAMMQRAR